jgi:GH35 family endo-1,4-beta-xylanase
VDFAEEEGLTLNGHCLVWDQPDLSIPNWLPLDKKIRTSALRTRIRQLAEHFGSRIPCWDVVNELVYRYRFADSVPMPDDFGLWAFLEAQKVFPDSAELMVNDQAWGKMTDKYVQILHHLTEGGAKLSGIGQQFHLFDTDYVQRVLKGDPMPSINFEKRPLPVMPGDAIVPESVWQPLDRLWNFKVPIHISEVTVPALSDCEEGRELQAMMVRDFYRLWFSHPGVNWITWWNLVDNAGLPAQDNIPSEQLLSGLFSETYEPKPAYAALQHLIHSEWKTRETLQPGEDGIFRCRAFYGTYRIEVRGEGIVKEFSLILSKDGPRSTPHVFTL